MTDDDDYYRCHYCGDLATHPQNVAMQRDIVNVNVIVASYRKYEKCIVQVPRCNRCESVGSKRVMRTLCIIAGGVLLVPICIIGGIISLGQGGSYVALWTCVGAAVILFALATALHHSWRRTTRNLNELDSYPPIREFQSQGWRISSMKST
ncbi:MAG TPA: hypothetical protein VE172_15280 [Stackebrandtia sp.]|uniref:hypothetical protein n=1 Tax=Stackebrandtia sp. TaxID=2023065 RepID=UPI002D265EDC|nr:hypothetical protein [Stackebrandtia sp.]HZE40169.1 hypothetical protein [Stackebrandtia sp.]